MDPGSRPRGLPDRIALIGFMGAGKSTVGRILARLIGFGFVDVDAMIEEQAGAAIARIFAERGEAAFRDMEAKCLGGLAARERIVIAAGGGAPVQERNRPFFSRLCTTFHLAVSLDAALARAARGGSRPLLARGGQEARRLYECRLPVYRSLGAEVDTECRTAEAAAREILRLLGNPTRTETPGDGG